MPNLFEIDDGVLAAVVKTFNKTEEALNEDVRDLKGWMTTQPHLPEIMDDKRIQNLLITNKCDIEKTKTKLETYYMVRGQVPSVFEHNNPKLPIMKRTMEALYFVPLPKLTKDMYKVSVHKVRTEDINNLNLYNVTAYGQNLLEIRLKEDILFGDIYIIDCKGLSFKYYLKATPRVLYYTLIAIFQKLYGSRLKGIYLVNALPIAEKLLGVIKMLMKPKLFERIHICSESNLKDIFPKEILPKDYGGEEKSLEELQEMMKLKLQEYQDRFDQLDQLRVDESLRPTKIKPNFGLNLWN